MERFTLDVREAAAAIVIAAKGELDLATVPELEKALKQEREAGSVVLDLRGVTFMDSSGLRTILAARRDIAERKGRLLIVRGAKAIQQVFEVAGLADRLDFIDDPDEA